MAKQIDKIIKKFQQFTFELEKNTQTKAILYEANLPAEQKLIKLKKYQTFLHTRLLQLQLTTDKIEKHENITKKDIDLLKKQLLNNLLDKQNVKLLFTSFYLKELTNLMSELDNQEKNTVEMREKLMNVMQTTDNLSLALTSILMIQKQCLSQYEYFKEDCMEDVTDLIDFIEEDEKETEAALPSGYKEKMKKATTRLVMMNFIGALTIQLLYVAYGEWKDDKYINIYKYMSKKIKLNELFQ